MAKCLEVLKETIPTLTRVGYLANPDYVAHAAQHTEMEAAAHRLGLTLHLAEARAPAELEEAFARLAAAHVGAFIVQQDALFGTNRALVIKLATQHRLPSMSWYGSLALHRLTLSFTTPRRFNRAHQERRDGDLVGADGCAAGEAQHDQRRVVSY